jgi:AraC-like DNA-binding protein
MNIKTIPPDTFLEKLLSPESTIVIKTAGITTIDKNWFITERNLPDHLIYFLPSGSMEASLNKYNFRLKTGNLLWVQPGVTQKFWMQDNQLETKVFFVRFDLKINEDYLAMENKYLFMEDFSHLQNHYHDFLIQQGEQSLYSRYSQKASIAIILCDLLKEPQKKDAFSDGLKRFQIVQIQKYIQKNIQKRFSSAELAKELKMNTDYFSRQFKKSFKLSPREYIKQERIRRAASLLIETNMNISELANFLGYEDIYQFSQQFKKVFNKSPNNYRKGL